MQKDPGVLGAPGSRLVLDKEGRSTVIEGDDFICNFSTDDGRAAYAIPINPGIPTSFPVAAMQAKMYERYIIEQLEYYIVPTVTEYGASEGEVVMMCSYDADDPEPASITHVLNNIPRAEGMPYHLLRLPLSKKRLNGGPEGKFIRTSLTLPTGTDIKTYDAGVLYAYASGVDGPNLPTVALIGKLHCKYRIRLLNQQVIQVQGITDRPPRNFQYSNFTSTTDNTGVAFPDYYTSPGDYTTFVSSSGASYWDFGRAPELVTYDATDPYAPLGDISGGFGKIFNQAGGFSLPQGRFLVVLNCTINANNDGEDPGNVDFFRVQLIRTGDSDNDFPFFGKELALTHHMEPHEGYDFSFRGGSVDLIGCIPGPGDYSWMYQLGTDANQGAAVYWTVSIVGL